LKLCIVAVGHKMPAWVSAGCNEYAKRMPAEARIEFVDIKPERRPPGSTLSTPALRREAKRIESVLSPDWERVVLDERGAALSSMQLAQRLQSWMAKGRDVAFIIGGADGLEPSLKTKATLTLSLSPMTLPHGLVRVFLAEQLYRAISILYCHPYHRR
jgi:23S rRNA (pseudouridine1915-N3)-methyltransferase